MIRKMIHIDEGKCRGCGGLELAVKRAVQMSGKDIPVTATVISVKGGILR